ncbi:hypothetical protein GCM10009612_72740 [Streptomyces beijiangensis]
MLEQALLVLIRAGLAGVVDQQDGLMYVATDRGPVFIDVLEAPYAESLRERAEWVVHHYPLKADARGATQQIISRASAPFRQTEAGYE